MQEGLGLILGYLIQYIFLSNVKKIRRMVKNILSVSKMARPFTKGKFAAPAGEFQSLSRATCYR